jgi:hypothetical protein
LIDYWLARLRRRELGAQSASLAVALLAGWLLAAAVATLLGEPSGWLAPAVVAGTCWLGAQLALVLCHPFDGPGDVAKAMLLGMFPRMGIPLTTAIVMSTILPPRTLANFGGLYYLMVLLVIFYHWTLAAEITLLLVGRTSGARKPPPLPPGEG